MGHFSITMETVSVLLSCSVFCGQTAPLITLQLGTADIGEELDQRNFEVIA